MEVTGAGLGDSATYGSWLLLSYALMQFFHEREHTPLLSGCALLFRGGAGAGEHPLVHSHAPAVAVGDCRDE